MHWGDMEKPFVLGDHERRIARLTIDAGAEGPTRGGQLGGRA
jgi:hypothetical protein